MVTTIPPPARARAQLSAADVRIVRSGRAVLDGVSLAVSPGSRWGVVGENGRGKSTLLQILAGTLAPDSGAVHRIGTLGVVEQEMPVEVGATVGGAVAQELAGARAALHALEASTAALADGAPGAERQFAAALEAAEALDAWDADRRVDVALESLGAVTDRSRPLRELSVGQRYRVRLACLLGAGHDFLLLDEPTNHLDAAGLEFLTARLRSHPGGVVVVSHDRALLTEVATSILDLDPGRDGRPRAYGDGFAGYRAGRRAELARWEVEYEQQQAEVARLTQDLSRAQDRLVTGWRPDKGTGKHQRATRAPALVRAVHRRQDELQRHAVTAPQPPLRFRMPDLPARPGVPLVVADDVLVTGRMRHPVSVVIESGSRLVIAGPNGAGKSTLLSVLIGELAPDRGQVRRGRTTRARLLRQESPRADAASAAEAFAAHVRALVRAGAVAEGETVELSGLGLFRPSDLHRPVRELSMGQRRRLDLATALAARPHVLLLDEPTNHLSIALVDELTDALHATEAAVVVATHDRQMQRDLAPWPRLDLLACPARADGAGPCRTSSRDRELTPEVVTGAGPAGPGPSAPGPATV
ncbi:ATP-binding cassette domain-containing protein [Geodermatophilus sp. YIM 151500]|uniref:ABC-F family ATP-binding cassette domain-containing protein n=1 Tax=Geodermatophilus sp. YIM 151500 TaxID=2984531 RepID=UPI0021E48AF9|nr:ABC-F family ATP-binding cassette domain-containing protein [Geodermatophilus sp. YIM 151500]MCV2488384.1 ATP-binding cassette domain-containing protein [Geodermatophilus sp. YIM 151500]